MKHHLPSYKKKIQKREPGDWVWLSAPPLLQTNKEFKMPMKLLSKKEEKYP